MEINNNTMYTLCDDKNFNENNWLTQGRLDENLIISPCPVNGEFIGIIPDAEGLCAKLSSNCQQPDIMYYQVAACDEDQIYEGKIEKLNFVMIFILSLIYIL